MNNGVKGVLKLSLKMSHHGAMVAYYFCSLIALPANWSKMAIWVLSWRMLDGRIKGGVPEDFYYSWRINHKVPKTCPNKDKRKVSSVLSANAFQVWEMQEILPYTSKFWFRFLLQNQRHLIWYYLLLWRIRGSG